MTEQLSPEWFEVRRGKVTASRVADATARIKSGWGAGRANYMAELVAERLTGNSAEGFTNAAMQWGTDVEPMARAAYEFMRDVDVEQVGFVVHPKIEESGASPDGFVGSDGLVEIKCPNTATHIATLTGKAIDGKYIKQMQWQMACSRRKWCDFVSYDPRLPEQMKLHVTRVKRDDNMIAELESDVREFLSELDATVDQLLEKYPPSMAGGGADALGLGGQIDVRAIGASA